MAGSTKARTIILRMPIAALVLGEPLREGGHAELGQVEASRDGAAELGLQALALDQHAPEARPVGGAGPHGRERPGGVQHAAAQGASAPGPPSCPGA